MSDSPEPCDVLVVGAGAAGIMAATVAADRGRRVILLEKNLRPGLKILISGGGRCNLTTTRSGVDLERQYGTRRGRFLRHALRSYPPMALRQEIEAEHVPLQEEDLEKIFPVSGRARDVLDALLRRAQRAGVDLRLGAPMTAVTRTGDPGQGFIVVTAGGNIRCRSLVLATGGLSYPKTGATGDGYPVAEAFGHTLVPTVPALAPLQVDLPFVTALMGIVVDAELSLLDPAGSLLQRRRRPTLFTHKGLSGPGPMDLAGDIEEHRGGCTVRIDFAPDASEAELDAALLEAARHHGRKHVVHCLPARLPERLRHTLLDLAGAGNVQVASLRKELRRRLVSLLKGTPIPVARSLGFDHAEVTRGGVALHEVDARTMQSRLQRGLYFVGEILDVDGPIGGFNFQAAFATGRLAGLAV